MSPKKVSWSLYAGSSTDRKILLDITRLGYAPKFAEGTAERCGEARGATGSHPAAAANRVDSASKGEIIGALHDPNSAMKLANRSRRNARTTRHSGSQLVPMEFSLAAFWSEKEKRRQKEGGRAERGKKGGKEGQGWTPIPVGIEGMGKYH